MTLVEVSLYTKEETMNWVLWKIICYTCTIVHAEIAYVRHRLYKSYTLTTHDNPQPELCHMVLRNSVECDTLSSMVIYFCSVIISNKNLLGCTNACKLTTDTALYAKHLDENNKNFRTSYSTLMHTLSTSMKVFVSPYYDEHACNCYRTSCVWKHLWKYVESREIENREEIIFWGLYKANKQICAMVLDPKYPLTWNNY